VKWKLVVMMKARPPWQARHTSLAMLEQERLKVKEARIYTL
jgi:hypothetical protein